MNYIGIITGLLAIVAYIVKLSVDYSKLKSTVQHLADRVHEDRQKNSEKFALQDKMQETLIELTASVDSMARIFENRFVSLEKQYSTLSEQFKKLSDSITEMRYSK